jgi:hypothetical protein
MTTIAGIQIPDSALAQATTEYIRDVESDLLYHHSRRVFLFGALSGERKQLRLQPGTALRRRNVPRPRPGGRASQ